MEMKQRAIKTRFLTMLLLWLGALAPAGADPAETISGSDPAAGRRLAVSVQGDERLTATLRVAAEAYEAADFDMAIDRYDAASVLDPANEGIRAMRRVAAAMRDRCASTRAAAPEGDARAELVRSELERAAALVEKGEAAGAYAAYERVWFLGGADGDLVARMTRAAELAGIATAPGVAAERAAAPAISRSEIDSLLVRARMAANAGDVAEARKLYAQVMEADPANKLAAYGVSKLPAADVAETPAPVVAAAPASAPAPEVAAQVEVVSVARVAPVRSSPVADQLALADKALADGRLDDAQAAYRKVLSMESGNRDAVTGLERVVGARVARNARERSAADSASALVAGVQEKIAAGDLASARRELESILSRDPGFLPAVDEMRRLVALEAEEARRVASAGETRLTGLQPIDARPSFEVAQAEDSAGAAPPPEEPAASEDTSFELEVNAAPAEPEAAEPVESSPVEGRPAAEAPAAAPAAPVAPAAPAAAPVDAKALTVELDRLHRDALAKYRAGDIEGARAGWNAMLAARPGDRRATTFLAETADEFERHVADAAARTASDERRRQAQELLNSPVTISTDRATPLTEFMRIISFSTVSELEYYIADGADAAVYANFVDKPLRDVLDAVLRPIGLTWEIDEKNLVTIRPELFTRTFNLSTDQLNKVRSLLDGGDLQNVIWGQDTPPAKGVEMTIDPRQRVFLVVGSKVHVQKIDDFMATLQTGDNPDLEMRVYKIRESDGPKIKALINALISSDPSLPFSQERKIYIDGSDLIVRDTPENIVKIEELLLDEKFIEELRDETLDIANFSLVPRDVENQNSEQISVFTNRVVESIETFLYARTGKRAAQAEGRRLWFDPATFQLTVVDTPTRLSEVGRFIESLPEIRQRRLQKVIFLEHAVAEEMASQLAEVLGIASAAGPGGGSGEQTILKMRRGEEATFRELRLRVIRVEEGDPNDRNDDEVEMSVITGTQQSNLNLRELDTVFFEDYELTAQDVQPSGGGPQSTNRGEGTARVMIRYNPPIEGEGGPGVPAPAAAPTPTAEEEDLTISPFGALNALIIRYDNPARLEEVEDLIVQLDKPTKQVQVETKFVQVNETRAKEFSADFDIAGLGSGRSLDTDLWRMNSRFAQFRDEARETVEPPIENPLAANLIKGTSIFGLVIGDTPSVSFQLRLLEAEGVINITNGPKVTMLDAVTGEFRIEKLGPASPFSLQGQGGITGGFSQQGGGGAQQYTLENEDASSFQSRLTSVVLEVTPEITSEKSIIFQIIAELVDFDSNVGEISTIGRQTAQTGQEVSLLPSVLDPNPTNSLLAPNLAQGGQSYGFAQFILSRGNLFRTRKMIDTTARTHDGGTIVLGGWTGERAQDLTSGVPVLRNMPFIGKLFASRNQRSLDRVTLLIFLTANLLD